MRPTWIPVGRYLRSVISPTGSGSEAICRTPSAMAWIVAALSVKRSTNAASLPVARAPVTSRALAASSRSVSRTSVAAIASSAAFLACVPTRASIRAAARARSPTSRMYAGRSRPGTLRLVMRKLYAELSTPGRATMRCSELVGVERLHAVGGADQDHVGAAPRKQAVGDRAGDVVDLRLHLGWIEDAQVLDVEDDVAVVGREALAQVRVPAELDQLVGDVTARHRDHFDRHREVARHADQLRLVDDAHKLLCHRGDAFLPRERAPAAFDHRAMSRRLVGAVDIDRKVGDVSQLDDRNTVAFQPLCGLDLP